MLYRLTAVALALLVVGCSIPVQPSGGTRLAFRLSAPSVAGANAGRLVATETVSVRVTVTGPADVQTFDFTPVFDSSSGSSKTTVTVPLEPGAYDFLVETLDAAKRVLTSGQFTKTIVAGPNQASLTLAPVDALTDGSTWTLAADQIAYFTLPISTLDTVLTGASSRFWLLASDGSYSGGGNAATMTLVANASPQVVRVAQTSDGTFNVASVPPPDPDSGITIDFALPTEPVILGANDLVLNVSKGETATVALAAAASFTSYTWYIDGKTTYDLDTSKSFSLAGNALKIEPVNMSSGLHEVMVVVTDATGTYSARFVMEVVR